MNWIKWTLPLILWTLLLLFLTWYPKVKTPDIGIEAQDKIAHLLFFLLWGLLMCRSHSKYEINRVPSAVKVTIIVGILFAIVDESMQELIPGRNFSIYDGLANIMGVLMSIPFFLTIWLPRQGRSRIKQEKR
ncbi:VanZ family protein [candidate division KSB1 bacterium]|nr:VanZ family protein [candidate division KSB1 bacterium]RQW09993.1 MAG: VanZ family protein [candidate division KSB1 bacterium]